MSLNDKQIITLSGVLLLLITLWIPNISPHLPSKEESFFELAILDENLLAERYYPGRDNTLEINNQVRWNIQINNHMVNDRIISIRVKLLNSTNTLPNSTTSYPSYAPLIYDSTQTIEKNEKLIIPFSWHLNQINNNSGTIEIESIILNNEQNDLEIFNSNDNSFSMVFELWVHNTQNGKIEFGWETDEGRRFAWTQIHFKVT